MRYTSLSVIEDTSWGELSQESEAQNQREWEELVFRRPDLLSVRRSAEDKPRIYDPFPGEENLERAFTTKETEDDEEAG